MLRILLALALLPPALVQTSPAIAAAQPAEETPFARRAAEIAAYFRGEIEAEALFSPDFLAQVPPAQLAAITEQLRAQHGEARGIAALEPRSELAGILLLDTERAVLRMQLTVDPEPPHFVTGLLVTGVEARNDSLASVAQEIASLPGAASFAAARLSGAAPDLIASHAPERPLAIGSAFKLFILAELSRQVQAGELQWDRIVRLDRRSLPSGILQDWPEGSPMTVHTLAGLMISRSDNSATDALLRLAGREKVEAMMARIGIAAAARNRPFLSTLEAFALKAGPEERLAAWIEGDEAARRALLQGELAAVRAEDIDIARLSGSPKAIETVEWFASAEDLVRTMDWFRSEGDQTAHELLAINSGLGDADPGGAYVGFKGGSEAGVINMTFLVRDGEGAWHAVAGSWNDPERAVDQARFVALLRRAVQLVR